MRLNRATLRELRQRRLAVWLLAAAIDWSVIVLTFVLVAAVDHPLGYALAIFPLGSRQQGLGALFHDASHQLASDRPIVNDALGNLLCALPLGLTLGGYRRYHLAHHRHLGTSADPENHHKRLAGQWGLPALRVRTTLHFLSDLVGGGLAHLFLAAQLTRPSWVGGLTLIAFWSVVLAVFGGLGFLWVPLLWVVSIATVFWSGVRLRIWTEHLGIDGTHRLRIPQWFAIFCMPHNIGLHFEHHQRPDVPFWKLGQLRDAMPEPRLVSLPELWRAFRQAKPLPSGEVGQRIDRHGNACVRLSLPDNVKPMKTHPAVRPASSRGLALFLHAGLPLAFGSAVYLFARPEPPHVVQWILASLSELGLTLQPLFGASRITAVFPDAAWSYALTATLVVIWRDASYDRARAWAVVGGAVGVLWELSQALGIIAGSFDLADLIASVVASFFAWLACRRSRPAPNAQLSPEPIA